MGPYQSHHPSRRNLFLKYILSELVARQSDCTQTSYHSSSKYFQAIVTCFFEVFVDEVLNHSHQKPLCPCLLTQSEARFRSITRNVHNQSNGGGKMKVRTRLVGDYVTKKFAIQGNEMGSQKCFRNCIYIFNRIQQDITPVSKFETT